MNSSTYGAWLVVLGQLVLVQQTLCTMTGFSHSENSGGGATFGGQESFIAFATANTATSSSTSLEWWGYLLISFAAVTFLCCACTLGITCCICHAHTDCTCCWVNSSVCIAMTTGCFKCCAKAKEAKKVSPEGLAYRDGNKRKGSSSEGSRTSRQDVVLEFNNEDGAGEWGNDSSEKNGGLLGPIEHSGLTPRFPSLASNIRRVSLGILGGDGGNGSMAHNADDKEPPTERIDRFSGGEEVEHTSRSEIGQKASRHQEDERQYNPFERKEVRFDPAQNTTSRYDQGSSDPSPMARRTSMENMMSAFGFVDSD